MAAGVPLTAEQRAAIMEFLVERKPWKWIAAQVGATKGQVAGLAFRNRGIIEDQQLARLQTRRKAEEEKWKAQEFDGVTLKRKEPTR